MMKIQT